MPRRPGCPRPGRGGRSATAGLRADRGHRHEVGAAEGVAADAAAGRRGTRRSRTAIGVRAAAVGPRTAATPAGCRPRARAPRRGSCARLSVSSSSAITQCAATGWYSVWSTGRPVRGATRRTAARRPSLVPQRPGPSGACGKPPCIVSTCSTVTSSLPWSPNSGQVVRHGRGEVERAVGEVGEQAIATSAFVAEKMHEPVVVAPSPNERKCTTSPSRPTATCAALMLPVVDLLLDALVQRVESGTGEGGHRFLQYGRGRPSMADVRVERVGEVDVITIDRPEVRNALRYQSYDELERAVRTTTARCLVITGADPAFCSRRRRARGDGRRRQGHAPDGREAAADAGRRRAAAHRRPGGRRGQRRRGRLGHGAGDDGRHPRGLGAGQVRRAVRAARAVQRRRRARPAGAARRPRTGGRAAVHRRRHRRCHRGAVGPGVSGWCRTRSCCRRRSSWPRRSPPVRRWPCSDSRPGCAARSTRTGTSSASGCRVRSAELFRTEDHREGVRSFLETPRARTSPASDRACTARSSALERRRTACAHIRVRTA